KFYLTLTVLLLIAFAGVNGQSKDEGELGVEGAVFLRPSRRCFRRGHICWYGWQCCSGDCMWYRLCR
uniref:UPF0506 domain-containing protein n=1 Tax=Mesocestoides corti TaxID=53468 RepID=A0A5K3G0M9_MESCO